MIILLRQELYKLFKRKSSILFPFIIIFLMLSFSILSINIPNIFPTSSLFESGFTGFTWAAFFLIIQASTIITMEFYYGTIKNLLYRRYDRISIILSKILAILLYSLMIYIIIIVFTIIIKYILLPDLDIFKDDLFKNLILLSIGQFVSLWLILSITMLLSCIIKNPGISISLGIMMYFALSIISSILTQLISKWEWIKWNPLNMLNLSAQITNESFENVTHLEVYELFMGNILYICIFILLITLVFSKKRV